DSNFTGGSTYATSSTVSGTSDPALFQNERWGQFTYNIAVTNGVYDVKVEFVELYYGTAVSGSCAGKRVFGMDILDTAVSPDLAGIDPCGQSGGPNTALIKTVSGVSVTDGQLNIKSVYGAIDDPEIAAIEVIPAAAPPAPPGPPTVTAKSPADASTGVSTGTTATATFSRGMDSTTITSSSFTLKA